MYALLLCHFNIVRYRLQQLCNLSTTPPKQSRSARLQHHIQTATAHVPAGILRGFLLRQVALPTFRASITTR